MAVARSKDARTIPYSYHKERRQGQMTPDKHGPCLAMIYNIYIIYPAADRTHVQLYAK